MSHAEKCPVCCGEGMIDDESTVSSVKIKCHGCNGKGWVEVRDEPSYYKPPEKTG